MIPIVLPEQTSITGAKVVAKRHNPECPEAQNGRHSRPNFAAQHSFAAQQKLAVEYYLSLSTYQHHASQGVKPNQDVEISYEFALLLPLFAPLSSGIQTYRTRVDGSAKPQLF